MADVLPFHSCDRISILTAYMNDLALPSNWKKSKCHLFDFIIFTIILQLDKKPKNDLKAVGRETVNIYIVRPKIV